MHEKFQPDKLQNLIFERFLYSKDAKIGKSSVLRVKVSCELYTHELQDCSNNCLSRQFFPRETNLIPWYHRYFLRPNNQVNMKYFESLFVERETSFW